MMQAVPSEVEGAPRIVLSSDNKKTPITNRQASDFQDSLCKGCPLSIDCRSGVTSTRTGLKTVLLRLAERLNVEGARAGDRLFRSSLCYATASVINSIAFSRLSPGIKWHYSVDSHFKDGSKYNRDAANCMKPSRLQNALAKINNI